jgi:hypothetical protein
MTERKTELVSLQFTAELGMSRQINIAGNIGSGADAKEINAVVDLAIGVINRQQAAAGVRVAESEIEQAESRIDLTMKSVKRLDEMSQGKTLKTQEAQQRQNLLLQLDADQRSLDAKRLQLEKLKIEAA